MFGLLRPLRHALPRADWLDYCAAYCNLCGGLARLYGFPSRLLVVRDVATADWLLGGAGPVTRCFPVTNCLKGGVRSVPQPARLSDRQRFLTAISAFSVGVKVRDDLHDQGGWKARLAHGLYRRTFDKARGDLRATGFDVPAFEQILDEQTALEGRGERDLTRASAPTGAAFGRVARHAAALQAPDLALDEADQLGRRIGRCVYLADAYRDYARDVHDRAYNPLGAGPGPLPAEKRAELLTYTRGLLAEALTLAGQLGAGVARRWRAAAGALFAAMGDDPTGAGIGAAGPPPIQRGRRSPSPCAVECADWTCVCDILNCASACGDVSSCCSGCEGCAGCGDCGCSF